MSSPVTPSPALAQPIPGPLLMTLRDVPLRVRLPEGLTDELGELVRVAAAGVTQDAVPQTVSGALGVVERLVSFLDGEMRVLTEELVTTNHRMNSHGSYGNQLQNDVSKLMLEAKQKLDEERQKFAGRYAKQNQSTLDALKTTLDELGTTSRPEEFGLVYALSEGYRRRFEGWATGVFEAWAGHTAALLKDRASESLKGTLAQLERVLGTPLSFELPSASPPSVPQGLDVGACEERAEMPSWGESYKESLFTGLNQVAMLASLVIIPVVGNFSHEQPVTLRVVVMSAAVVPIVFVAYTSAKRHRRKILKRNTDRALQQIQKTLGDHFRTRIERFKTDFDMTVQKYLAAAHQKLGQTVQRVVDELMEGYKRRMLAEQTRAKIELEQLQERQGRIRQVRGQLVDQVRLDLQRRARELGLPTAN